ncbi:MAG: carbohydrate ABC transporter permease [bacterium]|nr:carbohydrate ABC transporter permease [bacterium]
MRRYGTSFQQTYRTLIAYVLLTFGAIVFGLPFFWMLSTSLKPIEDVFLLPIKWIPNPIKWNNYIEALTAVPFGRYFINSTKITLFSIIGHLISCTLAAYGFARIPFKGRDILFFLLLGTMMLPSQVTIIPLFIIFKQLGWVNTHLPLYIPSFFGGAFYIFLLRQYFMTIPTELEEAAIIDGCGYIRIFWDIYLPLSKNALITVVIFSFMGSWNDFFRPLIFINSPDKFTVPLGLAGFRSEMGNYWHYLMAASVVAVIPCILLYFFFQRYFIEGIALTGLKS